MSRNNDRLYELLPAIYRMRDVEQGEPLRALLQVISEQVNLLEDDIAQLYENGFIETCEDWVVPYIADLVGYRQIHEAGEPGDVKTEQSRARNKILIPRREVANTIRYRRRKGTLALLELLANDVAGWPARAVEFYQWLAWTQSLNHLRPDRGRIVDIRDGKALDLIGSPFDSLAHSVDVRRINSRQTQGRYNIPSVGLFVWRLKAYSVTQTPAYCVEASGSHCFTFSVLGNDAPLFIKPEPETDPTHIADEFNLPVPIRRRLLEKYTDRLYGEQLSFFIWKGSKQKGKTVVLEPVKERIVAADLSDWLYIPRKGTVAVDPVLGRIAFPANGKETPKNGVWVSYRYGFSADLGGGEYDRTLGQVADSALYKVCQEGQNGSFKTLREALNQWNSDQKPHAVIEIDDSRVYTEPLSIEFLEGQKSLQLRAANGKRPVIRLLDWQTSQPDALLVSGLADSRFLMDGLMITGRGVQLAGDLQKVSIRHSTLVPGWELNQECTAQHPTEPSLEVFSPNVCVTIEHSILGSIQISPVPTTQNDKPMEDDIVSDDEVVQARCRGVGRDYRLDPIRLCIADSIVDAMDRDAEAIGAPGCPVAHAIVTIRRSTVFGQIQAHAVELAENSIFDGKITVARRQFGCIRFSYVMPGSRTPPRFQCQPDLVEASVKAELPAGLSDEAITLALTPERLRVRPQYNGDHYGQPNYCQLADACATEIKRGADDESEMGVFHDLFQPQRLANLSVRLDEYIPAGADVGVILQN